VNRKELEQAITEMEASGFGSVQVRESTMRIAYAALRAQLELVKNKQECEQCKLRGRRWACDNCIWDKSVRERTSYFEPKE
jgi:hypothetical protein